MTSSLRHNVRMVPVLAILLHPLAGCAPRKPAEPPPRAHDAAPVPQENSIISVPIDADQKILGRAIEKALPRTLWTIDKKEERCIPPQKVKVFGRKVNVTPAIGCTIVGIVTRGAIRLRGEGQDIVADVPINARISARDVGGVLKGKTATGTAMAHARIRLDVTQDWRPTGTVRLHYDWTSPPGIDFLGKRITFTDKADEKLQPIIRQLEKDLPKELAKADLRAQVAPLWRRSFTVIELNRDKPPVWMRVGPRKLIYGGYRLDKGRLRLNLGLEALTETFVGPEPSALPPTAMPPLTRAKTDGRFRFFIPVIADYRELEPVILRALVKRSRRPFDLPGLGPVNARFEKTVAYGTTGGRIAVGLTLAAAPASGVTREVHGVIWFVAKPMNDPGSARIRFTDLTVTGNTDGVGSDLLLKLGNSPGISSLIADALAQNFAHDLDDLLVKIRRAIERKQAGDFTINATIATVETGVIRAYGEGLYLPVRATGDAHIAYRPSP
ncbi:MAG TPA: DUF4403 family protein [Sphingobium sp.]|uniref:DUF4403 family protein n=1 Tax=Sphingobium sp. TaxID=1912891 RepID=UPI002ED6A3A4